VGGESSANYMSDSSFPAMTAPIQVEVEVEEVLEGLGAHETGSRVEEVEEEAS